jgi:hypothetical protein
MFGWWVKLSWWLRLSVALIVLLAALGLWFVEGGPMAWSVTAIGVALLLFSFSGPETRGYHDFWVTCHVPIHQAVGGGLAFWARGRASTPMLVFAKRTSDPPSESWERKKYQGRQSHDRGRVGDLLTPLPHAGASTWQDQAP